MTDPLVIRSRWTSFSVIRACLLCAPVALFVAAVDAQWLWLDDFSLVNAYRSAPLGKLFGTILATQTMHPRFAFLEQLLLVPWFRWWWESRMAVNLLYLGVVASLLAAGWFLAAGLKRKPLAWAGGWLLFVGAVISRNGWNTLEFKIACYLPLGIAMLVLTQALSAGDGDEAVSPLPWLLAAILTEHMAEVAMLAVVPLGAALVLRRRLKPWALAVAVSWPLAYWALNKLLFPHPAALIAERREGAIQAALGWTFRHAWTWYRLELVTCAALVGIALWVIARAETKPIVVKLAGAFEVFAYPLAGAGLLFLTQLMAVEGGLPGYLSERHAFFFQLAMTAGSLMAARLLLATPHSLRDRILAGSLALLGTVVVADRLPAVLHLMDARRTELGVTDRVRAVVQARANEMATRADHRELIVFVTAWPLEVPAQAPIGPTFLAASWSWTAFAELYGCTADSGCPKVSYIPNFATYRTIMTAADRSALCERMMRAELLVVAGAPFIPEPLATSHDARVCMQRLASGKLVEFAELRGG